MRDDDLLHDFVGTFARLDECWREQDDPPPDELNAGPHPQAWRWIMWRPASIHTDAAALEPIYARLPAPFPPLFERLVLSHRWLEVYLLQVCLLENPPGPGLDGLANQILREPSFVKHLIAQGYIPFARDADSYDPICFDTNNPRADRDTPVIRFEHEAMLSYDRVGDSWQLWPSFRSFIIDTIAAASAKI